MSTSRCVPCAASSVSVTRAQRPDRFAILWARARSTRIRRIISDATARKCLTRALAPKERCRSPSELIVHSRDQLIPRLEVALVPCLDKGGDIDGPVHRWVEAIAAIHTAIGCGFVCTKGTSSKKRPSRDTS